MTEQTNLTTPPEKSQDVIVPAGETDFYTINGDQHIRVTHVLSYWIPPQLKGWFIKNSEAKITSTKVLTAAQGSAIHHEAHKGTEDRLNSLLEEMKARTLRSEFVVWSKNGWAGQVDRLLEMNGKNYIVDLKSGSFGQVWSQLGAYSLAAGEMGTKVDGCGVIALPRDKTVPAKWFDYSEHFEEGQIQWCELYDYFRGDQYKKLKEWKFNLDTIGRSVFNYNWSFQHGETK
jgi:hypothetical protein